MLCPMAWRGRGRGTRDVPGAEEDRVDVFDDGAARRLDGAALDALHVVDDLEVVVLQDEEQSEAPTTRTRTQNCDADLVHRDYNDSGR